MLPASRSLEFGDLIFLSGQLASGLQAAAIPAGFDQSPGQKQSVLHALEIGFEVASVSAGCRKSVARQGASIPRLVAVFEACLATIGAVAGGFLERGNPRHHRI